MSLKYSQISVKSVAAVARHSGLPSLGQMVGSLLAFCACGGGVLKTGQKRE